MGTVALSLWGAFLVGMPFYVLGEGLPPPAYALVPILVAVAWVASPARLDAGQRRIVVVLAAFVLDTILVSLSWFLWAGDARMLLYPAYYLLDLAVFWLVLRLGAAHGLRFATLTGRALTIAILLQVAALAAGLGAAGLRRALFFDNPNQLGYWVLLAGTTLVLLDERAPLGGRWVAGGLAGAVVLGVASLSRSAVASLLLLLVLAARRRPRRLAATAIAIGAVLVAAWAALPGAARSRLFLHAAGTTDSLAGRGYDRMANHPALLLLGAGEGGFDRFLSAQPGEVHSSLGTILFAYGVPGLVLFASFLALVVRRCPGGSWLLLVPVLLYGLTHQGLRFAMFWVVAAAACLAPAARSRHAG